MVEIESCVSQLHESLWQHLYCLDKNKIIMILQRYEQRKTNYAHRLTAIQILAPFGRGSST